MAGEFGVYRRAPGAVIFLGDTIAAFKKLGIHYAFYSFREDKWDAMDYELGVGEPNAAYLMAIRDNRMPGTVAYKPNPLSDLLRGRASK